MQYTNKTSTHFKFTVQTVAGGLHEELCFVLAAPSGEQKTQFLKKTTSMVETLKWIEFLVVYFWHI